MRKGERLRLLENQVRALMKGSASSDANLREEVDYLRGKLNQSMNSAAKAPPRVPKPVEKKIALYNKTGDLIWSGLSPHFGKKQLIYEGRTFYRDKSVSLPGDAVVFVGAHSSSWPVSNSLLPRRTYAAKSFASLGSI